MDKHEARQKFEQSKSLFAQKRYPEAMIVLDELNAAFPNEKHIMYARAMCLAELQRPLEAIQICEQAVARHNDPKSQALLGRLRREHGPIQEGPTDLASLLGKDAPGGLGAGAGIPDIPAVPDIPDYAGMPAASSNKPFYVVLGCVVGVVLILAVGFPLLASMRRGDRAAEVQPTEAPAYPETARAPETSAEPSEAAPAEPVMPLEWYYDYDQGINIARQYHRPVCIFFHDGGAESARIEETLFQDPAINPALSQFVNIRVLYADDHPAVRRHDIDRVPAVVVMDTEGNARYSAQLPSISANDLRAELATLEIGVAPTRTAHTDLPNVNLAIALVILLSLVLTPWPLYLTLMFTSKLPHDEFLKDIVMVSLVAWGASAVAGTVPCLGPFIAIYILHAVYDMGLLDFVIYWALQFVFGAIIVAILVAIVGTAFVDQLIQMTT